MAPTAEDERRAIVEWLRREIVRGLGVRLPDRTQELMRDVVALALQEIADAIERRDYRASTLTAPER